MNPPKPKLDLAAVKRRPLSARSEDAVQRSFLDGRQLPMVIEARGAGTSLEAWGAAARGEIERDLARYGAILFRGFDVASPEAFHAFIRSVSGEPFEYKERSSPRSQVQGNIYTSTEYPAAHEIFFHNENSYAHVWPRKLFFCCLVPAEEGGETPLVDVRKVYASVPPDVRERFERHGVTYARSYSDRLGLSWQTVFQTDVPAEADAYARASGYTTEWHDGRLRTRRTAPAVYRHPATGEPVWFNHGTFFHLTTLDPVVQQGLLAQFGEADLPNQTFFGDGSPIDVATAEALRRAYREHAIAFPWRRGDVVMIDNMLVAHGRAPFRGARQVLVAMSEPWTADRSGEEQA